MKFIDLFAGIGGFRYGLESVAKTGGCGQKQTISEQRDGGITRKSVKRLHPFNCVYSNEWDKYASQIYKKHYGECDTTDIRRVKQIPDHDLLCAGFPCQAFSIAGKRKGFEDTRGTLFFEIARIARDKRPRYLLLENVKGLLSHDKGKTFATILGVLSDLGYRVEWQVLNSKHFGVPQNRERVFIVGHLGGFGGRKVFPIGEGGKVFGEKNQSKQRRPQAEVSHTLKGSNIKADNLFIKETQGLSDAHRVRNTEGVSCTLKGLGGGQGAKTGLYAVRSYGNKDGSRVDYLDEVSQTIASNPTSDNLPRMTNGTRIRRLTPTECERLQGFPDGWTEGLSDTQRYKCLGNAITTNVITVIGEKLIKGG